MTGERTTVAADAGIVVERVRRFTDMPVCVGVGVSMTALTELPQSRSPKFPT